jgi:hypothetical protein
MSAVVLPPPIAEMIWQVLVETCGADNTDHHRETFVRTAQVQGITEYRFMGKLGFGGKLYAQGEFRVDCYHEDLTSEREKMIDVANERLKQFWS